MLRQLCDYNQAACEKCLLLDSSLTLFQWLKVTLRLASSLFYENIHTPVSVSHIKCSTVVRIKQILYVSIKHAYVKFCDSYMLPQTALYSCMQVLTFINKYSRWHHLINICTWVTGVLWPVMCIFSDFYSFLDKYGAPRLRLIRSFSSFGSTDLLHESVKCLFYIFIWKYVDEIWWTYV